jgi:hypothetical protein
MLLTDRQFLLHLAKCLENADRVRLKGELINEGDYIIIKDADVASLVVTLRDLVKRDATIELSEKQFTNQDPKRMYLN